MPRTGPRMRSVAVRVSSEQEAAPAVRAPSGRTIEECEADAVAGRFPAPPPLVRPKAPEGTPQIRPLVSPPMDGFAMSFVVCGMISED